LTSGNADLRHSEGQGKRQTFRRNCKCEWEKKWYNADIMSHKDLSFRCIAYQEKDGSFTGVCLDLDIVEEGHVSLEETILSVNDAVSSHLQVAAKLDFPEELVSRSAPKEYWNKLREITKENVSKKSFEPFQFFTTQPPTGLAYA